MQELRKELNEKYPEINGLADSDSPAILQSLNVAQETLRDAEFRIQSCRAALNEFCDLESKVDDSLNSALEIVANAERMLTNPSACVSDLGEALKTLDDLKSENVSFNRIFQKYSPPHAQLKKQ